MNKDQIYISVETIIKLNQDLDEKVNVRCCTYDNTFSDSIVDVDIWWNDGYDNKLEKEMTTKKTFQVNAEQYYTKGMWDIANFIDKLAEIKYDDEIDTKAENKFYRDESKYEASKGN